MYLCSFIGNKIKGTFLNFVFMHLKRVYKVTSGNIALISGLSKTYTGDVLVQSKETFDIANKRLAKESEELRSLMQSNLDIAPPVYFCTVEPASEAEEKKLTYALECLQREDPSLRVSINEQDNLGRTTIQGMGELHLEIIKDRILKEYNLDAYFGPLNIGKSDKAEYVFFCHRISEV